VRLSCLEPMLGEGSTEARFALAREAGFDGVDVWGDTLGRRCSELQEAAACTGLRIPTVYGRLAATPLLAATARERAQAVEVVRGRLQDAARLGATSLIVVPVTGPARIRLQERVEPAELGLLAVLLSELAEEAAAQRVRIVLEPLNRSETHLLRSARTAAAVAGQVGGEWVATMVDTYHLDLEDQAVESEIEGAGERLALVHLSDRGRSLPGEGGIDFVPVLAALARAGYRGWLGYECAGTHSLDRLRRSVEFVRGLIGDVGG
jgi:sugar phosphate isomerase/epimerase